jgi:hypothetical protein
MITVMIEATLKEAAAITTTPPRRHPIWMPTSGTRAIASLITSLITSPITSPSRRTA